MRAHNDHLPRRLGRRPCHGAAILEGLGFFLDRPRLKEGPQLAVGIDGALIMVKIVNRGRRATMVTDAGFEPASLAVQFSSCEDRGDVNDEPAQASASPDWRKILGWVALAFVVAEVVSAFFIEFPVAALVFAALFLIGWFLLRHGGLFGVLLVGVLLVIELAGLPFYERKDADDWIVQGVALVLSLVGIVAAVGALWRRPRAPRA